MKKIKIDFIVVLILCLLLIVFAKGNNGKITYNSIDIDNSSINGTIPKIEKIFKVPMVDESVLGILKNYPELKNIVIDADIAIPNDKGFIPQGIALMKKYILITGYYDSKENSKCYVFDRLGNLINIVILDINSHVGAIIYDERNDLIWLPDNHGVLNAYDGTDFLVNNNVSFKYRFDNVGDDLVDFENKKDKLIAFLSINDRYLYIGNFFNNKKSIVKRYEIVSDKENIDLKYLNSFYVPSRTQSITFLKKDNKTYMLLSNSYRRRNPSYINIYEYDDTINDYSNLEIIKIKAPPMLEQIYIDDNLIYLLFESTADKYSNCPEIINFILTGEIAFFDKKS